MKAHLIGKPLIQCLREIPNLGIIPEWWAGKDGFKKHIGIQTFLGFPKTVVANDGQRILVHNPQKGSLERRGEHLMMYSASQNAIDPSKAKWLPNVVTTLENAQFCLDDQEYGTWIYGLRYSTHAIHLVIVQPKLNPKSEDSIQGYLITQFCFDAGSRQKHLRVRWVTMEAT